MTSGSFSHPVLLVSVFDGWFSGKFRGQRLIEVGTGPTIHTLISACEYFEEIVVSDYVDSNREEIERWLTAKDGCFDWNAHIQFVCDLEGKR